MWFIILSPSIQFAEQRYYAKLRSWGYSARVRLPHLPTPSRYPICHLLLNPHPRIWKKRRWGNAVCLPADMPIHLVPGRSKIHALQLSKTLLIPSLEVCLELADPLPASAPPLSIRRSALVRDLVDCRPIRSVIVLEIHLPAIRPHQLGGRDVEAEVLVEFQLLAREGVDEGGDELEEAPYCPGDCIIARVLTSGFRLFV